MARKDELGRQGEDWAADFLVHGGYEVIERNWRCADGEIDLIVQCGGEVVFVEVKTRSSLNYGHPFEAITPAKLGRLRRLAGAWCEQSDEWPTRIRIDVIAIVSVTGAEPAIEHLIGVF